MLLLTPTPLPRAPIVMLTAWPEDAPIFRRHPATLAVAVVARKAFDECRDWCGKSIWLLGT